MQEKWIISSPKKPPKHGGFLVLTVPESWVAPFKANPFLREDQTG